MQKTTADTLERGDQFVMTEGFGSIYLRINRSAEKDMVPVVRIADGIVRHLEATDIVIKLPAPRMSEVFLLAGCKLVVTDNRTAEEESIRPTDPNFAASLAIGAEDNGDSVIGFLADLFGDDDGCTTQTGFNRRIVKE